MSVQNEENKEVLKENKFAQMTGAIIEEVEVSNSQQQSKLDPESEPEQMVTTREIWHQPWIKIVLVSGIVLVFVAFFAGMVNQGIQAINSPNKPDLDSQARTKADNYVVSDRENQTGELKTKIALTSQERELQDLKAQPTPQPTPTPTATTTPEITPTPTPKPKPQVVYVPRNNPAPSPKPIQPAIRQELSKPKPIAPTPKETIDPMEQWLSVSSVGVYGSSQVKQSDRQVEGIEGASGTTNFESTIKQEDNAQEQQNVDYSGKPILVGSYTSGSLKTPVMWGGNIPPQENQSYLIQLSKPLKGSDGSEVLPKNSYIVARVTSSNDSGFVQMEATSALINTNGATKEKNITENSVLILAKHGKPLQAKSSHRGKDVGSILLTSVLGGVRKAAELENRPNNVTNINSAGLSSVTTTNGEKNLAAGFAEGSLKEILSTITENQKQHLQKIQAEPSVFIIKPGTDVRIFFNRTVYL